MTTYEKFFSFIGFLGFAFLLPGILYAFDIHAPAEFLAENLGRFGNLSVMTVVAFGLIGLAVFFGGGDNVSATFLGLVVGFFLISTAAEVGFMKWFRDFALQTSFLSNIQLNYLLGIGVGVFGFLLSFAKKLKFVPQFILLAILPVGFLVASNAYGIVPPKTDFALSIDEGIGTLSQLIDEKYQQMPAVKKYVDSVLEDDNLSEEEKKEKMENLKDNIVKNEGDISILESLKKQNEEYKKLLKEQSEALSNIAWCANSKDTSNKVHSFEDAVKPNKACVRDFAVSLAKAHSGSYSNGEELKPGPTGIKQVAAIHVHLSSKWAYVNDPVLATHDYWSPADHTLAIGLAGDCDDFSIVMASMVEAIGGKSRIMYGTCSGGAHAWAEVFIGNQQDFADTKYRLKEFYNKPNMAIAHNIDEEGNYWLPLDWRLGNYTCNESENTEKKLYDSYKRVENTRKAEREAALRKLIER
jgi:hypothetical protein